MTLHNEGVSISKFSFQVRTYKNIVSSQLQEPLGGLKKPHGYMISQDLPGLEDMEGSFA